jgi:hypothetical protein
MPPLIRFSDTRSSIAGTMIRIFRTVASSVRVARGQLSLASTPLASKSLPGLRVFVYASR